MTMDADANEDNFSGSSMSDDDLPPCIHGFNLHSSECPYTLAHSGLTCSMPHKDQPKGKFFRQ